MHEYYLKDQQGNYITDQAGHPLPIDRLIHDVDEFGRLLPGASQYGPSGSSPTARPRATYSPPLTRTRTPVTSRFRRIGSSPAGVLGDIQAWWTGLKTEHKWGIGALGGLGLLGIIIAATRKGEAATGLKKI